MYLCMRTHRDTCNMNCWRLNFLYITQTSSSSGTIFCTTAVVSPTSIQLFALLCRYSKATSGDLCVLQSNTEMLRKWTITMAVCKSGSSAKLNKFVNTEHNLIPIELSKVFRKGNHQPVCKFNHLARKSRSQKQIHGH